ncbi:hypothetical protein AAZX31_11G198500 [Glycine max]|uniref:Uncharacterized protein n=2 Tax=Glycine subgen. Soja TaxID=1462606 RepID=K7LQT9_SOYBN|nr:hypothetical protein JHK87_031623 [Glycine soja]KAG4989361.1 hypothetical protein JHK85_032344 [Glycine max]KAG4994951.1 hypothetical protein JHK86_031778 [Glycine max]KAG5124947.1 hypothetical protein JHK82_031684 [Glycine max]KAG5146377.1 hypothetical protein JHK84_031920 [Glycine max]
MAKASMLFPCLIVLFLITYATGFVDACNYPCKFPSDCNNLRCLRPDCKKYCLNGCCLCNCRLIPPSGNV